MKAKASPAEEGASLGSKLLSIHQRMKAVASVARLPLRGGQWSGVAGSVLGQGTGSSIDFQDQRAYVPGDDPRHINWQAYARSGNYTMKLYRQEVSPRVDMIFDYSGSMFLTPEKDVRTWELAYFCMESALRMGASLKLYVLLGDKIREMPLERALAYDWPSAPEKATAVDLPGVLSTVPFRAGSLRILLSDLLFEIPPESVVNTLVHNRGRAMMLAPFCPEEARPDWSGNVEFEDCEVLVRDKRRVESEVLARYLRAYETHFTLWREQGVRRGAALARVSSEGDLLAALRAEALGAGCVEM